MSELLVLDLPASSVSLELRERGHWFKMPPKPPKECNSFSPAALVAQFVQHLVGVYLVDLDRLPDLSFSDWQSLVPCVSVNANVM